VNDRFFGGLHAAVRDCQNRINAERTRDAVLRECTTLVQDITTRFPDLGSPKLTRWLRLLEALDFVRFDDEAWHGLQKWIDSLLSDPPGFSAEPPGRLRSLLRMQELVALTPAPSSAGEAPQKLRVSILLIEDTQSQSEMILAKLRNEYRQRSGKEQFEVSFTAFPDPALGAKSFEAAMADKEKFLGELDAYLMCQNRLRGDRSEFVAAALLDYDLGAAQQVRLTAREVAKLIRAKRPGIDLHLLTSVSFDQVFQEAAGIRFGRPFSKRNLDEGGSADIVDTPAAGPAPQV